ncbi:MAG: hypothetical protein OXQ96_00665, partial [Alphaproteobacteria bacterium]|nr:hypothetical protein [Alphaproteobacteria bacterium]
MRYFIFCFVLFIVANITYAATQHPILQKIQEKQADINTATLAIRSGNSEQPTTWQLTHIETQVFLGKLLKNAPALHIDAALYQSLSNPTPNYQGVEVALVSFNGQKIANLLIFNQQIQNTEGYALKADMGRELELWLFGTAKLLKQQLLATQVIPIFSFKQCLLLNNLIIETVPRQCLLPNNNILLDVSERPTLKELEIQNFEDCLKNGKALIKAFPRRCLAAGGRIFTEPPRLVNLGNDLKQNEQDIN